MIKFLLIGILRDRTRSLLPIAVVSIGVMVTVMMYCWINGIMGEAIIMNANINNGHVKLMSRAYAKEAQQFPNDLALLGIDSLLQSLKAEHPDMDWVPRIRFGAMADFPNAEGETRAQGTVVGWALDLLSPGTHEQERFQLAKAIVAGKMPAAPGDALISTDLAERFQVRPGDRFTLFGATMDGSIALKNFNVAGTVRFGISALDRGAVITDVHDAQAAFQMNDGASEILGFFNDGKYNDLKAQKIAAAFNAKYAASTDEFAPQMFTFKQQEGMGDLVDISRKAGGIMTFVFILAMSVVLWNTGLIGCLRRFNEFGVRLALGEGKSHIYKTLLYEGFLIGLIGTVCGTALGLFFSYLMQEHGLDIAGMMKNSSLMLPAVAKAMITPPAFYIGFIPGVLSMMLGNALAGLQIFKRKTAQLFKELEV